MAVNPVEQTIRGLIAYEGNIAFERYMRLVLYHPVLGYYRRKKHPIGRAGDYITAPEVAPMYGSCVARALIAYWGAMGRPKTFDVVECGAGRGKLALDVMAYLEERMPQLYGAITYYLVEQSVYARLLFNIPEKYLRERKFVSIGLADLKPGSISGCMLSNEFFDAFPVHRLKMENETLKEIYVAIDPARPRNGLKQFAFAEGPFYEFTDMLQSEQIWSAWQECGAPLQEGQQAEVSLGALNAFRSMAAALKKGFVLTVDYGDDAEKLYTAKCFDGTVMTYTNQQADAEYYADIGEKDITAHLNFTLLKKTGRSLKLKTVSYGTLADFLLKNGILGTDTTSAPLLETVNKNQRIKTLLLPGGFGETFKVLVQEKM